MTVGVVVGLQIAKQMQDLENRRKKEREAAEKIKVT